MTETPDNEVLTLKEAADLLRVGRQRLIEMSRRGRLPAAQIGGPGGSWRFRRRDLEALFDGPKDADGGRS